MTISEVNKCAYRIRLDRKSSLTGCERVPHFSGPHQYTCATEPGHSELRVDRQRPVKACKRLVEAPQNAQRIAAVYQSDDVFWIDCERYFEVGNGLFRLPQILEGGATVD